MSEGAMVIELNGGRTNDRRGDWMQTWTGGRFYPLEPRKSDVDIMDIAFALGNIARYNGHCKFYSVAEHSVLVSRIVPPEHAFQGLMHDAHEAYIGDITRPMQLCLKDLGADAGLEYIERNVCQAIADQFRIAPAIPEWVKRADVAMLALEKKRLWPRSDAWILPYDPPSNVLIECLPPMHATLLFLRRYCELLGLEFQIYKEMYHWFAAQDDHSIGRGRMH